MENLGDIIKKRNVSPLPTSKKKDNHKHQRKDNKYTKRNHIHIKTMHDFEQWGYYKNNLF